MNTVWAPSQERTVTTPDRSSHGGGTVVAVGSRRANGEGLIHQRPDGRWEARIDLNGPAGRRLRRSVYGRTKAEVAGKLRDLKHTIDKGMPVTDGRVTVEQFLDTWLAQVVKPGRRHATWQGYEVNVRKHLVPLIGRRPLVKLTPADVQTLLNLKREEGLSSRTVQYIHATLRAALGVALRWGMVERNVATLVEPVKADRKPVTPFAPEEAMLLLEASADDRLGALWTVALAVGLRPSEALGLRWADVDLDGGSLFVRHVLEMRAGQWSLQPPKSRTSRRTVPLPGVCVDALRRHRRRQLEERIAAPEPWEDHDFVFTDIQGRPIDRTSASAHFRRLQKRAGVSHHRLYDCRHTAATFLLVQGVAPRVVMEVLGHSSYSLTMDTYTHVMPVLLREAADAMDRSFGRAN